MKTVIVSIASKNVHKMPAAWKIKAYCDENVKTKREYVQDEREERMSFNDVFAEEGVPMGTSKIKIIDGNVNEKLRDVLTRIVSQNPDVLGFSCYIWNIDYIKKLASDIRKLLPDVFIVLGGPEVSFENDFKDFSFADCIIKGAGETAFCSILERYKNQENLKGLIIEGCAENFESFPNFLTDEFFESFKFEQIPQIENRLVYYESSLGCPFSCSYCLSSAYRGVQYLPLERVFSDINLLIKKGAKVVKFTDRTFNADKMRCAAVLEYLKTLDTDCVFHFEAAADLFNEQILSIIKLLPKNRVQFEIGIQSVYEKTLEKVNRKTDIKKALQNIETLVKSGNCHIHVDLIAGLPLETLDTFKKGVNEVLKTRAHNLQLGFLKVLKGSKYSENENGAIFSSYPPYEVLSTGTMSFEDINYLKKIEQVIEKFYNGKMFSTIIKKCAVEKYGGDYFSLFSDISSKLENKNLNTGINLKTAYAFLWEFLKIKYSEMEADGLIINDCLALDPKAMPDFLKQKAKQFRF